MTMSQIDKKLVKTGKIDEQTNSIPNGENEDNLGVEIDEENTSATATGENKDNAPTSNEGLSTRAGEKIPTDDAQLDEIFGVEKAIELACRGKKMQRIAWQRQAKHLYIIVNRDETKPTLTNGKHGTAYNPSIDDVIAKDWVEIL